MNADEGDHARQATAFSGYVEPIRIESIRKDRGP